MYINFQELEKLLLKNWANFLDPRKCLDFVKEQVDANVPDKIQKLMLSRFELSENGFILWMEFASGSSNYTTEAILKFNGELVHIETYKLDNIKNS